MKDDRYRLKERLEKIWSAPDFQSFFEKYSKRPAHKVLEGTILFNAGDFLNGIYFVKSGLIKLYKISDEGKETIVYLTGPGNMLGLRALISKNECAHHYAEAITDCEVYQMSRDDYFDILSDNPEYLVDLGAAFIERLNHAERRVEGFVSDDATAKVANFLLDSAIRFGKNSGKSITFPFPLTHQRIAEFVGVYRETVTNSLHELEKLGAVKLKRSTIKILDLAKLKAATL